MSRRYPKAPILSASVMVKKGDRVLLIKRATPPNKGCWSLPGGKVEIGETVKEAATREVLEESGIVTRIISTCDIVDVILYDAKGEIEYQYAIAVFLGEYQSGEPEISNETSDVGWFTYDEIEGLNLSKHVQTIVNKQCILERG